MSSGKLCLLEPWIQSFQMKKVLKKDRERAFDVQAAVKSLVMDALSEVNNLPFLTRIYRPNDG